MSFNRPQITLYIKEPQWGSGYYLGILFPSLGLTCECFDATMLYKTLDIVGKVIVVVSVVPIEKSIKSTIRDINKNGENG